jgi:hypothetical protein
MTSVASVAGARAVLSAFGFDAERSNERSALVLLGLLGLSPGDPWSAAGNEAHGVTALMEQARQWGTSWTPNTRETVRWQTLHQFVDAGLVEYNHDNLERPVNSPRANYRVSPKALAVIQQWGVSGGEDLLAIYLADLPGQRAAYAVARDMHRIPVTLPGGSIVTLSPGGQNVLLAAMVEEFCARWTPGGQVLYLGDADSKLAKFDEQGLASLGVTVDHHGKFPDLVVWMSDRNWLVLLEAASSHGPVDAKRHAELKALFAGCSAGLVFVSCFPSRAEMRRYLASLAWETEAWTADNPDHLIHFDGERFLGPYES